MSKIKIYSYSLVLLLLVFGWYFTKTTEQQVTNSEHSKVAIRAVGHQLLLANSDSTSIVLPIEELKKNKFLLTFENEFSFQPNDLVKSISENFTKAKLPSNFRVSVIDKSNSKTLYSFEMYADESKTIIPCSGRKFEKGNYQIEVLFLENENASLISSSFMALLILIVVAFIFEWFNRKKILPNTEKNLEENYISIGSYKFYPEQNKLITDTMEIGLSRKECELLSLFITKPNEIITRDELSKKVWEDNGVYVGRSLDTFISKLRKKLKEDKTIKLTNVHGIGYKLEV